MNKEEKIQGVFSVFSYLRCRKISFGEKFIVVALTLIYIISPVDLIPDIPIIGWLDDIGVGAIFLAFCAHRIQSVEKKQLPQEEIIEAEIIPDNPNASSSQKASASSSFADFNKSNQESR